MNMVNVGAYYGHEAVERHLDDLNQSRNRADVTDQPDKPQIGVGQVGDPGPGAFVMDEPAAAHDPGHVGQRAIGPVRRAIRESGCNRAVLVGHNAAFDLSFLNAAVSRTGIKRNPFHPFSTFDTVSLAALAYGQTVLARAVQAAGYDWDSDKAHSAVYDTERTADLFCAIINAWNKLNLSQAGLPVPASGTEGK